jgi:hypothetical protein
MTSFLICCLYLCLVLGEFFLYLLVQNFFWMPNFGSVKNTSPQCLCCGSVFVHLQALSDSHHNHNDFVSENNRISFVGVSYLRNVSCVLCLGEG